MVVANVIPRVASPVVPTTAQAEPDSLLTDLVAWWKLDESSGNGLDASGNSKTLTDNNTVGATTGKVSGARRFTKADSDSLSRTITGTAPSLTLNGLNYMAFAGWVNLADKSGYHGLMSVKSGVNDTMTLIYLQGADRFFASLWNTGGTQKSVTANSFGAPSAGTWYFFYLEIDNVAKTIGLSINNGTLDLSTAYSDDPRASTDNFIISASQVGGGSFDIDELARWNRKLTTDERTRLYNSGNGMTYPG